MIGGLKQLIKLFSNYDTKLQKYDTKNIYKVDEVFYYRKKINYKIYRISLKTKSIKIALNRKKIFDKMNKEELLFTLQKGDYKFIFEYETIEELNQHLNSISNIVIDKDKEVEKFENVNRLLMQEKDKVNKTINFYELETKFIANKKEELEETKDKLAKSTWQKYENVFKDLKEYFDVKDINDINENQYKEFRNYLIKKKLNNVTINEKMQYTNMFLNFAKVKKLIKENNMENIKKLKVEETKRELFTLAEMKNIFSYDNYNYNAKEVFKILLFTGMRINEFYNLKKENLKNKDGIDYIEVTTSKTKNGLREIPIHKEIKKNLERFDFNEIHKMDASSFSKKILYELYRVITKGDKKTLHTFRKNFANQIINKHPNHIELFQEILGHSQGSKSLSLQTYGKGFNLENKKVLIDSLEFDIDFEPLIKDKSNLKDNYIVNIKKDFLIFQIDLIDGKTNRMPKELVERYTNEHNKIMDGLKELGLYSLIEKFNLNEKINIVMDYVIRNEKANLEFDLDLLKEVINDYIEILNEEKAKK